MRTEYRFQCPGCDTDMTVVGESVKRSILDDGCLVCSGPTDPSDFERLGVAAGSVR